MFNTLESLPYTTDVRHSSSSSSGSSYGYTGPSYSSYSPSSSSGLHFKKDGSLDMRYSSSKQAAASETRSGYASHSSASGGSASGSSGLHHKKDGTLDMRYRSSKETMGLGDLYLSNQWSGDASSSDLHYKKDGSLDMRYKSSKQAVHGTSSGSMPVVQQKFHAIPDYVPKKKDGTPDMRTKAAKDWVASEASASTTGVLPAWVPRKKDGSLDLTTAVGRTFANHGSQRGQKRVDYWLGRIEDDLFRDLVEAQRRSSVPAVEPTAILETPHLYDECRGKSGSGGDFKKAMPDGIPQIDYCSLQITADEGSELGRGSFGVVLKGKWNGVDVAVKKLHLDKLTKKERDSFCKEIIILANLGMHPNLVMLYGYSLNPPCIVMELVQRGSLSYLLHYCDDPEVEAKMTDGRIKKNLIIGVVEGMRQLHASRIVHGDLKPILNGPR